MWIFVYIARRWRWRRAHVLYSESTTLSLTHFSPAVSLCGAMLLFTSAYMCTHRRIMFVLLTYILALHWKSKQTLQVASEKIHCKVCTVWAFTIFVQNVCSFIHMLMYILYIKTIKWIYVALTIPYASRGTLGETI